MSKVSMKLFGVKERALIRELLEPRQNLTCARVVKVRASMAWSRVHRAMAWERQWQHPMMSTNRCVNSGWFRVGLNLLRSTGR